MSAHPSRREDMAKVGMRCVDPFEIEIQGEAGELEAFSIPLPSEMNGEVVPPERRRYRFRSKQNRSVQVLMSEPQLIAQIGLDAFNRLPVMAPKAATS